MKESFKKLCKWVGVDGALCFETSALLILFFMGFLPITWSLFTTLMLGVIKSVIDFRKGYKNEKHDLFCNVLGCALGVLISLLYIF